VVVGSGGDAERGPHIYVGLASELTAIEDLKMRKVDEDDEIMDDCRAFILLFPSWDIELQD